MILIYAKGMNNKSAGGMMKIDNLPKNDLGKSSHNYSILNKYVRLRIYGEGAFADYVFKSSNNTEAYSVRNERVKILLNFIF